MVDWLGYLRLVGQIETYAKNMARLPLLVLHPLQVFFSSFQRPHPIGWNDFAQFGVARFAKTKKWKCPRVALRVSTLNPLNSYHAALRSQNDGVIKIFRCHSLIFSTNSHQTNTPQSANGEGLAHDIVIKTFAVPLFFTIGVHQKNGNGEQNNTHMDCVCGGHRHD